MPETKKQEESKVEVKAEQPVETKAEVKEEPAKEETKAEAKKEETKPAKTEAKKETQELIPPEKLEGEVDPAKIGEPEKPEEKKVEEPKINPLETKIQEQAVKIEELTKTADTLAARLKALEEAIDKSGLVQTEQPCPIGATPNNLNANKPYDDAMADVLKEINSFRR